VPAGCFGLLVGCRLIIASFRTLTRESLTMGPKTHHVVISLSKVEPKSVCKSYFHGSFTHREGICALN
jgi:hypothetical protein